MIHQAGSEPFTTNEMSNEDVVHVRKGQSSHFGKMGGRVPSFYSTPSNSKLNELSVSDPYHIDMRGPAVQQGTNSGDSYSMSLNDVHHSITASIASDSTLSDNGFDEASVDRTMHVRCDSDLSLYSTTGVRPQSYYVYKENDSDAEEHTSSSDGSFRALASRRKGSRDAHAKPFIEFGNSSDDLTRVDSLNIPPCLSRSSSRHSIRGLSRANSMAGVEESDEHEGMARTPSMADFYYRRGHSNDRLETLGEYQGKDQEDTE